MQICTRKDKNWNYIDEKVDSDSDYETESDIDNDE